MILLSRILGGVFSILLGAAFALRFNAVRERLYAMWPQSRAFIEDYYPMNLNIRSKVSETVGNLRGNKKQQTTRSRYGESFPGEAK